MSQKHLTVGSKQPPKVEGKLRLYSMEYCPYAQRSRLVLKIKNLPHDIVNINLGQKPEWYFKLHPEGKVPALDTGSEIIVESLLICDYLDEKYPNPPLYPSNPERKNRDKELIKKIDAIITPYFRLVYGNEEQSPEAWAKDFGPALEIFTSELAARGTTFFGGNKPGMLDYMLWPFAERAELVRLRLGQKLPIPSEQYSIVKRWRETMKEDAVCKEVYHPIETHWKIVQNRRQNVPTNFDEL